MSAALRWQARHTVSSAWLHEEVARRMTDRLQWFRDKPASWMHWEPVRGGLAAHQLLRDCLPEATCHVAALDEPAALAALGDVPAPVWHPARWLRRAGARAVTSETQVAMLWANMLLHLEPQPQTLMRRWHDHIHTNGFLMFSCLGPDTLSELRSVYAAQGWPLPAHAFTDMHDWGDMLVQSGFAEPVMDMERVVLTYSGADAVLADLRSLGRNLSDQRFPALRGRGWHARLRQSLEMGLPRGEDGRLQLSFEIIYGHAYKAAPRKRDAATVSLDEMRAMLRGKTR